MWLEEIDEFFKGYLPYYILLFLPIFIIISPINPVHGSHEFPVYRMQQYDLNGLSHGSRGASINLEARSLTNWKSPRHCVVTKMKDLSVAQMRDVVTKAGALLILVPSDLTTLSPEEKEHLSSLEGALMNQETSIPVYFIKDSPEFEHIFTEISVNSAANDLKRSAAEALFSSVAANGYQIVVSSGTPSIKKDVKVATIQGQLIANNLKDEKVSTIAIVAHYDSFGIAPELSFGADSNGSGIVVLFELIRLFSELYADPKTHGKFNIIFLLSGGGKINFMGSKKWLEDQLDSLDGSLIQDASYVVCLDTLANSDSLYMHVSKPPKEGTPPHSFFRELKAAAGYHSNVTVEGVHKKINLAEDILAWEHERFSIRRLPAFTLSTVKNYRDNNRNTILDVKSHVNIDRLEYNARVIAEAIARHIYNVSNEAIFGKAMDVNREHMEFWLDVVTSQPRSTQILGSKDNYLIKVFKDYFDQHLIDTKVYYASPDKRDPEFNFYDITKSIVNIYSVKPAVFDLFLTFVIALYLTVIYFLVQKFSLFYNLACCLTAKKKTK
ncbi:nicalin [Coccinella septempunctata]|uniref:nicalin n=1 Tax=Coccinella septempunctata TaxID=41139 RepID=UPI001D081C49|nr:nicalin [Coccinella septempunctata]